MSTETISADFCKMKSGQYTMKHPHLKGWRMTANCLKIIKAGKGTQIRIKKQALQDPKTRGTKAKMMLEGKVNSETKITT